MQPSYVSMMCPPQRVKIVSTPSFASAAPTKCPPEMTPASWLFLARVSSAVVDRIRSLATLAMICSRFSL